MVKLLKCFYLGLPIALSGCANITGLDAASTFSCPRENGISCASLTEVYEKDLTQKEIPNEQKFVRQTTKPQIVSGSNNLFTSQKETEVIEKRNPVELSYPKRTKEKLVAIWIAPWVDDDGDLHEAHLIYAEVKKSHWAAARFKDDVASRETFPLSVNDTLLYGEISKEEEKELNGAEQILKDRKKFEDEIKKAYPNFS